MFRFLVLLLLAAASHGNVLREETSRSTFHLLVCYVFSFGSAGRTSVHCGHRNLVCLVYIRSHDRCLGTRVVLLPDLVKNRMKEIPNTK